MLSRLLAPLFIAGLLLPAASADEPDQTALVAGHAIDADTIQITFAIDAGTLQVTFAQGEAAQPGDLVSLCDGEPPLQTEARVFGFVDDGCFQSSSAVFVGTGFPTCPPLRGGAYIFPEPGIEEPQLDEECIHGIIDDLIP